MAKPVAIPVAIQPTNVAIPNMKTLHLKRLEQTANGIFSELLDGSHVCYTATHAYSSLPKTPNGTYKCVRGMHRLEGMDHDFETFEITGVIGHTNILFHVGNAPQKDSAGCELMGQNITTVNGVRQVVMSRITFEKFMQKMTGINEFQLVVS